MLIEDSVDDAELTVLAFKRAHIPNKVMVAEDGAVAIERLFGDKQSMDHGEPILVILDLNLPKIPGLEVLRRIRADERTRFLPVVILTTSIADADIVNSYAAGANAYVRKPVAFEEFLSTAANLGTFWLVNNRPPPFGVAPSL